MLSGSRRTKLLFISLCALGPVVFLVKTAVKPEGDVLPAPKQTPAVPILLITLGGVAPADLAGPRSAEPMPHLSSLLRDSMQFASSVTAAPGGAPFLASVLSASLPMDHGVTEDGARAKTTYPTLATVLKKASADRATPIPTWAFTNATYISGSDLQTGIDRWVEKPGVAATELVRDFAAGIPGDAPPRFFAWFDFHDVHSGRGDRKQMLENVDRAVGEILAILAEKRIQGDGVILLATDPGAAGADGIARGIVTIQFPFEYRAGVVCPVSASSIDLAPTALEILRIPPPPAWRGRSRAADARRFLSSGPALAGPAATRHGVAWIAEEWPRTLVGTPSGEILNFIDRSNPSQTVPPASLLNGIRELAAPKK
jgi:hypothetical protein